MEQKNKTFELKPDEPVTLTELFGKLPDFKPLEPFKLYLYTIDGVVQVITRINAVTSPKHIGRGTWDFNSCANTSFHSITGCKVHYRITQSGKYIAE